MVDEIRLLKGGGYEFISLRGQIVHEQGDKFFDYEI